MTANWKSWFAPSLQSREWELTRDLFLEVRREMLTSPFATDEGIQQFIGEMVEEICASRGFQPSVPFGNALWQAIGEFLESEGLTLRLAQEPPRDLTLEEGVRFRSLLTRHRAFLRERARLLPIWRTKLVILFSGILASFPLSAVAASDDADEVAQRDSLARDAKAHSLCADLPLVMDRSIVTFFDSDISDAHLFDDIREIFDRNVHAASGVRADARRNRQANLIFPTDNSNHDPAFLVNLYFRGTPLEGFFSAELPFVVERSDPNRGSAVSFAALLGQCGLMHEESWWKGDSTYGFEGLLGLEIGGNSVGAPVPCGFTTATAHALLSGVTGSGKNNLINVLVASLAIRYSPEELEFFMIDLKEGVEFQRFAQHSLPHARVISVSNDAEFALNVLRGLDAEMEKRGFLFTSSGAKDISSYREKTGKRLSRILLIVDEAKTLYGGEDASYALSFFDRMAAKGRSFGLHLLLANQSFSGASLRSSTISNLGIRLVTKGRGERSAENVLDSSNTVLESLSQHDAVYNDGHGSKDFNHPCRVPEWKDLDDAYLERLAAKATRDFRKPVVFNGRDLPSLSLCSALNGRASTQGEDGAPRMWLGAPMSLDEFVQVEWRRDAKQHFLIADVDEQEATGLLAAAWISLLETVPVQAQQFEVLDLGTPRKAWSEALRAIGAASGARYVELREDTLLDALDRLASLVEERTNARMYDEPTRFLILHGVHRLRELANASATYGSARGTAGRRTISDALGSILREGAYVGVHVIAWCDTAENVRRVLEPGKLRGEFGIVAAGKQSDDMLSRALVGNGKAATIGSNRMVLANSLDGDPCVFRPYRLPETSWLVRTAERQNVNRPL